MSDKYRIFGAELSPYSVKVRSYFRYKRIPHEWVPRDMNNMGEFRRYAKLPLIPLVITPEDEGVQDSTPLIEGMEERFPEPGIHPPDPVSRFVSALIEEYADEWANKPMFHYRWTYEADQQSAAERIVGEYLPGAGADDIAKAVEAIKRRMIPRLSFVGSCEATREGIERSYERLLGLVEEHLRDRSFLFGERPAFADFGLYAQLYQCWSDPTPGALMRRSAPRVVAWVGRMLDPRGTGEFESWDALAPTLTPLLAREVSGLFLPWSAANARALAAGEKEFTVELEGEPFTQQTQKYHAKSLAVLKDRYAAVTDRSGLDGVLEETGCRRWLR